MSEPDFKAHLESVMAELAEHLPSEDFSKIAKRPAYKAAMAAREGRPAKGPPRIVLKYKQRFGNAEPIDVPFDTVEPINGKLVVTFSAMDPMTRPLDKPRVWHWHCLDCNYNWVTDVPSIASAMDMTCPKCARHIVEASG